LAEEPIAPEPEPEPEPSAEVEPDYIAEVMPISEAEPEGDADPSPEEEPFAEPEPEPVAETEGSVESMTPEPVTIQEPVPVPEGKEKGRGRKPRVRVKKMKPPEADDEPVKLPPISPNTIPNVTTRVKLPSRRPDGVIDDVFESAKGTDLDESSEDGTVNLSQVSENIEAGSEGEVVSFETVEPADGPAPIELESLEEIQASAKAKRPQGELPLDGGPKGKFEGENPNLIEGEDLDIPPFLRNR
jgi:hypothetical protein